MENTDDNSQTQDEHQPDESGDENSFKSIFGHLSQAANIAASMGEESVTKLFGEVQEQVKRMSDKGHEVAQAAKDKASGHRASVEAQVEEIVESTLSSLKVATKDDIERLERLINELKQTSEEKSDSDDVEK